MMDHRKKYKLKPSVDDAVIKRVVNSTEKNKKARLRRFDSLRNLPQYGPSVQGPLSKVQERMLQLQKWKEQSERKKKEAMANKKKPFVVGKPKNSLTYEPPPPIARPLPSTSSRNVNPVASCKPGSSTQEQESLIPGSLQSPTKVTDRIEVKQTNTMEQNTDTTNKLSEHPASSSYSSSSVPDADVCDMSVEHFRSQLDSEMMRLTEVCAKWEKIQEQMTLPNEIQEAVLSAVGQTRLLMSEKMMQFASLLQQCENPEPGQQLVTTNDLQGFWDMVSLQIDSVNNPFKKLEESQARASQSVDGETAAARPRQPPRTKPARGRPACSSSGLKEFIAAARKAKEAQTKT